LRRFWVALLIIVSILLLGGLIILRPIVFGNGSQQSASAQITINSVTCSKLLGACIFQISNPAKIGCDITSIKIYNDSEILFLASINQHINGHSSSSIAVGIQLGGFYSGEDLSYYVTTDCSESMQGPATWI